MILRSFRECGKYGAFEARMPVLDSHEASGLEAKQDMFLPMYLYKGPYDLFLDSVWSVLKGSWGVEGTR